MTGEQKKQIHFAIERLLEESGVSDVRAPRKQMAIDDLINELDKIFPAFREGPEDPIARLRSGTQLLSADPLGAERRARSIHDGIGAPPDFGRSSA